MELKENDNIYNRHVRIIAEWLKNANTNLEIKDVFVSYETPFKENFFGFYSGDSIDDILRLGTGEEVIHGVKEFIIDLAGKEFIHEPYRNIFNEDGTVDNDLLDQYYEHNNDLYLSKFNLVIVYEDIPAGYSTCNYPIYAISLSNRRIYLLRYEEYSNGDVQYLDYKGYLNF